MPAPARTEEWGVWRSFYAMRRQLDLALERQLQRDARISAADFEILITLLDAPERRMRARDLGEWIGWEKSRISHQVSRMEQRALVEKQECEEDARGVWVVLTNEGRRVAMAALRDHSAAIRSYFFDVLTAEEQDVLERISHKVLDAIQPPCAETATPAA